ncbi:GntR family transcriptional regulator [Rheinheimera baltica]|uniref:GntR family transcriptional regulator n=1 Tax=Rheinheimera baltica TaxID=67576 RepID=A0ABT9HVX7_9GAMM|nr:GntR family transcriptional regulator [Rheinheimera baltica]MDP5135274.1 GntR family transcriptional regulator [Rheinheimera baltica]
MLKKQQLYHQLKNDIQQLHWQPGIVLTQQQLSAHYGVSRIVVRDVQQQLLNEGWLTTHGKAGMQVPPFNADEADELAMLRLQLEPLALKLAAPTLSFTLLGQAEDVLLTLSSTPELSPYQRGELNWQFHRLLYQSCNKPHLLGLLEKLHQQVSRYLGYQDQTQSYTQTSATEHQQLLTLLRRGDTEGACAVLTEHIATANTKLVSYLRNK